MKLTISAMQQFEPYSWVCENRNGKFLFKFEETGLGGNPIWKQILYVKSQSKFSNCYKIVKDKKYQIVIEQLSI